MSVHPTFVHVCITYVGRHRIENGGTLPWAVIDRIERERRRAQRPTVADTRELSVTA